MHFFRNYLLLEFAIFVRKPIAFAQALVFALVTTQLFSQTLHFSVFQEKQNIFGILFVIQYFSFLILLQNQMGGKNAVNKILLMNAPNILAIFFTKCLILWFMITLFMICFFPIFNILLIPIDLNLTEYLVLFFIFSAGNLTLCALGTLMSALLACHKNYSVILSISILPLFLPILMPITVMLRQSPLMIDSYKVVFFLALILIYIIVAMQLYGYLVNEI